MLKLAAQCILVTSLASQAICADVKPLFKGDESIPADAIVLFDGKDLSQWVQSGSNAPPTWKVENGYMQVVSGNIVTKKTFKDCQLHVEFWLPLLANRSGQARANSGVYVQGLYEIQVLDSYGLKSGGGDCGAIYGVAPPMLNACRPPEQWQVYDIFFRAPRFDAKGARITNARLSVLHNGVWIHDNQEIPDATPDGDSPKADWSGPVLLQDHHSPVRYRNIWIRELPSDQGRQ